MDSVKRSEERSRLRADFLQGKIDMQNEQEVLSFFLSIATEEKNCEDLSRRLLKKYKCISNLLNADAGSLSSDAGCSERTAVAISVLRNIQNEVLLQRNSKIKRIKNYDDQKEYISNLLGKRAVEQVGIVCLDADYKVIGSHVFSGTTKNFAQINSSDIAKIFLSDNPVYILIGHNHPEGFAKISAQDVNFTLNLVNLTIPFNIKILNHIIISEQEISSFTEQGYGQYLHS